MSPQQQLAALDLTLPPAPAPTGVYKPILIVGRQVYVSGHGPVLPDGSMLAGRVGCDIDEEAGKTAARQVGLTILATLVAELGTLDRLKRVIKVFGMVQASDEFTEHASVINGCSELFAAVWGPDKGVGTRSAVGMGSLHENIPVEIEAIFELG